jgi:hypothetical protein
LVVSYPVARNAARAVARSPAGAGGSNISLTSFSFLGSTLPGSFALTRGSTATYFDTNGNLVTTSADTPRFDTNPATLAARGILIEQGSANLLLQSQDLNNASWTKNNSSIVNDAVNSPDGTQNADKLIEDLLIFAHRATQSRTVNNTTIYTVSAFVKKAERGFAFLVLGNGGTGFTLTSISINLTSGAVSTGTGTPINAFTQTINNGWFRVGFSLAASASASADIDVMVSTDGVWANRAYAGDNASGIYAWGLQLESTQGNFATSYIPTTTTSVTRNAETLSSSNIAFFNPNQGTLYSEIEMPFLVAVSANTRVFAQIDLTASSSSNRVSVRTNGSVAAFASSLTISAASILNIAYSTILANTIQKAATAYASGNSIGCARGTLGTVSNTTYATGLAPDRIVLGQDPAVGYNSYINGWIRVVNFYSARLPNAMLQTLTT